MTGTIRWGILGTGWIADAFTTDLLENGFVVGAVGSRTEASAQEFAEKHGIPAAYGSYEELAADPGIDAIYVSTPHPFHAENALLALEGGKHVLVEKPFTLNASEARAVVHRAEELGLVVLEAMWTRWLPHMLRVREIIAAGTLGELRGVIADHNQLLPTDPKHRLNDPALGGGALLDLGIYPVSFAVDLLGIPSKISAISTPTATGVDGQTSILLGFPGGSQAILDCALDVPGPNRAAILGTRGRIELDQTWYAPTVSRVYDETGELIETIDIAVGSRGMQFQAWEMERIIRSDMIAGEILPPSETVAIMAILDEVRSQIGLRYPSE